MKHVTKMFSGLDWKVEARLSDFLTANPNHVPVTMTSSSTPGGDVILYVIFRVEEKKLDIL